MSDNIYGYICGCEVCKPLVGIITTAQEKKEEEESKATSVSIGDYSGFAKVVGTDIIVSIPFNDSSLAMFVLERYRRTGAW